MSGAFDKKADKISRREERTRKEIQEKKKVRRIAIIVVAVFAVLLVGALFINSKFVARSLTAITVGGVDFSAAEFDFFYSTSASEYLDYMAQQFGDMASSYGPSNDRQHSSQIRDHENGETWADFFIEYAIVQISDQVKRYNAALAAGYTVTDEVRETIESEVAEYRLYAEMYGYPSLEMFLQNMFGSSNLNETVLRNVLEFLHIASSYSEQIHDSFTYGASDLAAYYFENRDTFDSFEYRYFIVRAEDVERYDFDTEEEYEEANEAALAEARAEAERIVSGINSEDDYIAAAREYDEDEYWLADSTLRVYPGSWLSNTYQDWMREDGRQYGDVIALDASIGSYVVFFVARDPNEYRMAEMRQILVMREEVSSEFYEEGEDDPEYLEAFEFADSEARERAEEALRLFIEGGATEDMLIELMEEHSEDATEGGFYDLITKNANNNKMVPEIENWLFAPERQVVDYELIRTEDYGYHLVYFSGFGDRYCDYLAETEMRSNDYAAWEESLDTVDMVKRWAFIFTQN